MTAPKAGDRVRVTFEGVVGDGCHLPPTARRAFHIDVDDSTFCVPESAVIEVLRPLVKVGDVIETVDELDALPDGAVVLNRDGLVLQKGHRQQWDAASAVLHFSLDSRVVKSPVTVLYLPDGAA